MKIGFDAKRAFNNPTGLGNYARFVISSLIQYHPQHEYFLFTPQIDERYKNFFSNLSNVRIITPDTFFHKTFPSVWRSMGLAKVLQQYEIDVYHGLSNELPNGIEKYDIKSIVTIHDLIFLRYPDYYNTIDTYIYKKKFSHATRHASRIVCISRQSKHDVVDFLLVKPEKIDVIYLDCDEAFYQKKSREEQSRIIEKYKLPPRFLLSVGTIENRKNQLSIVKALTRLKDKKIPLVLVGRETDYMKEIKQFAGEHDLQNRVIKLQHVSHDDLPGVFQLSELTVYISEFEGFGIPVLEALRSGVPCITSNVSSLPEVGGDAVLYVDPHSDNELATQIELLLGNEKLRSELIEKGYKQTSRFTPQAIANELMQVYQS